LFATATIHLSKEEFQAHLEPIVEILFKVNDRAVRGAMLGRISMLVQYLDAPTLNRVVFEPMCSGFTDSSAPLRELTLKSAIVLVSYLTQPNLEKLTRYLVRLQSDPEDSIRTNTVIFIGKVAPSLSDIARSKLILPAFMRAMTDGFVPCRLAGLKAICASSSLFDEKKLASEVLPAIAPSLVDTSSEVRDAAMKAVDDLLIVLRQYSEAMRREEARQLSAAASTSATPSFATVGGTGLGNPEGGAALPTPDPAPKSSSSSYLSGLSSWASSKLTNSAQATEPFNNMATTDNTVQPNNIASSSGYGSGMKLEPMSNAHSSVSSFSNLHLEDDGAVGNASAGWSDDDFDDIDPKPKSNNNNVSKSLMNSFATEADDDFMSQFDSRATTIRPRTTASKSKLQVPAGLGAGANRRQKDPTTSLRKEDKVKPSIKKLNLDDDPIGDGWDDF
jgi:SCY1-like protein 1